MGKLEKTSPCESSTVLMVRGGYTCTDSFWLRTIFRTKNGLFNVRTFFSIGEPIVMNLMAQTEDLPLLQKACSEQVLAKIRALFPETRRLKKTVTSIQKMNDVLDAIAFIIKNE